METANGAIWRESFGFVKIGKDGVSSFGSRMTQGIFGHPDWTGAVLCNTRNGVARQKLDTNTEWCFGRFVAFRGKWWLKNWGWRRKSQLTMEAVQDAQCLHCRRQVAWMRFKTESPRQSEWKRGKELELSEVQEMCFGTREQRWWADVGSTCGRIWQWYERKPHHDEDRVRDIQVGKRGSEATNEEQPTIWARRSEFECSSVFTSNCCSRISCEWWDAKSARVRTCADDSWWRRTKFRVGCLLGEKMNEWVVTSEKCWISVEETMLEISREVNWMNWFRIWHVSTF